MNPILLLSTSLGFGALSGVNLYLATFLTGVAIRFNILQVQDHFQGLESLANPWIIGISGVICAFEMVADKIPVVDSVWDTVHTLIRPIGAMAACLSSLGAVSTEWSVAAALLAGMASATTHTAKMGTRIIANASPEPVSNAALSVAEDAAVATGTILLLRYPYVTASVCLAVLISLWFIIPRIFRKIGGFLTALKGGFSRKTPAPVS